MFHMRQGLHTLLSSVPLSHDLLTEVNACTAERNAVDHLHPGGKGLAIHASVIGGGETGYIVRKSNPFPLSAWKTRPANDEWCNLLREALKRSPYA